MPDTTWPIPMCFNSHIAWIEKIFFPMDKYEDHGLYPTVIEKVQWLVQQDPWMR